MVRIPSIRVAKITACRSQQARPLSRLRRTDILLQSRSDESTSALMVRVYRNLRHGKTLPEALRAAMLQLAGRALMPAGDELDSWDSGRCPSDSRVRSHQCFALLGRLCALELRPSTTVMQP